MGQCCRALNEGRRGSAEPLAVAGEPSRSKHPWCAGVCRALLGSAQTQRDPWGRGATTAAGWGQLGLAAGGCAAPTEMLRAQPSLVGVPSRG